MTDNTTAEAFVAYADCIGVEHATEENFEETFCGEWDSELAYAEDLFDECYSHEVPSYIQNYIDYESFANDLFMGDYFSVESDGGVFVFRNT